MPKKKTKYPAKFRQTLEKVAAGREGRASPPKAERDGFDILYRAMLPRGSVDTMHTRRDETPFGHRLVTRYVLSENTGVHDVIRAPAPWEKETP